MTLVDLQYSTEDNREAVRYMKREKQKSRQEQYIIY